MSEPRKINLVELSMPVLLLLWATQFSAFDVLSSSPVYRTAAFLTNIQWAMVFGAIGGFQAIVTVYDFHRWRRAALAGVILLWICFFFIFLTSNYRSQAVSNTLFIIFQCALAWQKLGKT